MDGIKWEVRSKSAANLLSFRLIANTPVAVISGIRAIPEQPINFH